MDKKKPLCGKYWDKLNRRENDKNETPTTLRNSGFKAETEGFFLTAAQNQTPPSETTIAHNDEYSK